MKKLISFFAALTVLSTSVSIAAPHTSAIEDLPYSETGYIFMLEDNVSEDISVCSTEPEISTISSEAHIYHADDLADIESFTDIDNIKYIALDSKVTLSRYPDDSNDMYYDYQWQFESCGINSYWKHGINGMGVKAAIIDTGIHKSHEDLKGSSIAEGLNACALLDGDASRIYDTDDLYGHGTAVASIIAACTNNEIGMAGITNACTLIPIRIHDPVSLYSMTVSSVLAGLNYVKTLDVDVVNMSLGFEETSPALGEIVDEVISELTDEGVIVVASIGNNGKTTNEIRLPAKCRDVITVGAVEYENGQFQKTEMSTANDTITVSAPGKSIFTASIISDGTYEIREGTSFAAPIVAAAAIGAKQIKPDISTAEFVDILKNTSIDIDEQGYDINTGYGLINFAGIISALNPDTNNAADGGEPSDAPADVPTVEPTDVPTDVPTVEPTDVPTVEPTDIPTDTPVPTEEPIDPDVEDDADTDSTEEPSEQTQTPEASEDISDSQPSRPMESEPAETESPVYDEPTIKPVESEKPEENVKPDVLPTDTPTDTPVKDIVISVYPDQSNVNVIHCEAVNSMDERISADGIIAIYDDQGRLVELKIIRGFEPGSTVTDIITATGRIEFFVWQSIDNMIPYSNRVSYYV